MQVEIREFNSKKSTRWGEVDVPFGLSMVIVNGKQAGWTPREESDPNFGAFHPLSGFPQELVADVQKNCDKLTSSLKAPVPHQKATPENE